MNLYSTALIFHVKTISRLLSKYGLEAHITMEDFNLHVRGRHRYYRFYPESLRRQGDQLIYSPGLTESAISFVGWRPYFNKRWPLGFDKLAFKSYCQDRGLPTPAMWRTPSPEMRDFVVKHSRLSFGQGLRGPFRTYDPANTAAQADPNLGYYEAFVHGKILKAWYWQDRPVCIELKPQPTVVADGKSTLRELTARVVAPGSPQDEWKVYAEVAAYQGLRLDDTPAKGRAVMIDYRFRNHVEPSTIANDNKLGQLDGSPLLEQLREYGAVLWQGIPEDQRDAMLFAIDAIVDDNDKLWLLEMNCNPACHPDVYDAMFETLYGPPDAKAPAAIPPDSALPVMGFAMQPGMPSMPFVVAQGGVPAVFPQGVVPAVFPQGSVPAVFPQGSVPPLTPYSPPAPAPASPEPPVTRPRNRWLS